MIETLIYMVVGAFVFLFGVKVGIELGKEGGLRK